LKVLVFDDERDEIGKMYIGLLRRNFSVEVTMDVAEILTRFNRMAPNVVIVNTTVALFNAAEICAAIKTKQNVPIILLLQPGMTPADYLQKCNADDFIFKPVDIDELEEKIKALPSKA